MTALLDGLNKLGVIPSLVEAEGYFAVCLLPLPQHLRTGYIQHLQCVLNFAFLLRQLHEREIKQSL